MEIFDNRYEQLKLLGRGAFSEVWKVRDIQTGVTLALKIYLEVGGTDETGSEMLSHEFALMVNVNHKNLLRPLFYSSCQNRPYLIIPYCEKGNIGNQVGRMTEDEAWKLLRDCASALAYLHSKNPPILHQDIKPANILQGDNGEYMLTDFGISVQMKATLSRVSHEELERFSSGTIAYMAPERFSRNNLPVMANDIFSLGATVYEMLSGELPFGNDGGLLLKKGADVPEVRGNFSPLLKRTLESCLTLETWQRPEAKALEETADKALSRPETRWIITGGASRHDMSQSAFEEENVAKKTVVVPRLQRKPRWPYYLSAAIAALLVAFGACWWYLSQPDGDDQTAIADTETVSQEIAAPVKTADDIAYERNLSLLASNSADSVEKAFKGMGELALKGHLAAIHQVAYTYAWAKDAESIRRKQLLNIDISDNGLPQSVEVNKYAVEWLDVAVRKSDSTDYKAMYWLSHYYINGIGGVQRDFPRAIQLLHCASSEATKSGDYEYKSKTDLALNQLKK